MARAVATNFYTPKELTFQDGGGQWAVLTCFASFAAFLSVLCGKGFGPRFKRDQKSFNRKVRKERAAKDRKERVTFKMASVRDSCRSEARAHPHERDARAYIQPRTNTRRYTALRETLGRAPLPGYNRYMRRGKFVRLALSLLTGLAASASDEPTTPPLVALS